MTVEITLSRGLVAIVDDADVALVQQHRWHAAKSKYKNNVYARSNLPRNPHRGCVLMHRLIIDCPPDVEVDHIDGDGLNNRRCNLRVASRQQNSRNRRPNKGKPLKGIRLRKSGSYAAIIYVDGKPKWLGSFAAATDAALAYDEAALRLHGEFARLNFPEAAR